MEARKVFVIAHRCNTAASVEAALGLGANGIECDIRSNDGGRTWFVDHDIVAPWSTPFVSWLASAADSFARHSTGAIIIFDIKTPHADVSGILVSVDAKFPAGIEIVLSVSTAARMRRFLLANPKQPWGENVRFSLQIDEDSVDNTFDALKSISNPPKMWASFGVCNVCFGDSDVQQSTSLAILRRNELPGLRIGSWTYPSSASIKRYLLSTKVDAILVTESAIRSAVEIVYTRGSGIALARRNPG